MNLMLEVHLRPVAVDRPVEVGSDGFGEHEGFASRPQHKHRKIRRDERPEPRSQAAAFEGRFVDSEIRLIRQDSGEFVIERL